MPNEWSAFVEISTAALSNRNIMQTTIISLTILVDTFYFFIYFNYNIFDM